MREGANCEHFLGEIFPQVQSPANLLNFEIYSPTMPVGNIHTHTSCTHTSWEYVKMKKPLCLSLVSLIGLPQAIDSSDCKEDSCTRA
jgi:hypothetical protein